MVWAKDVRNEMDANRTAPAHTKGMFSREYRSTVIANLEKELKCLIELPNNRVDHAALGYYSGNQVLEDIAEFRKTRKSLPSENLDRLIYKMGEFVEDLDKLKKVSKTEHEELSEIEKQILSVLDNIEKIKHCGLVSEKLSR